MTTLFLALVIVGGLLAVIAAWRLARCGGNRGARLRRGLAIWAVYAIVVFVLSVVLFASDGPQSLTGYGVVWYGCLVSSLPVVLVVAIILVISVVVKETES